MSKLFGHIFLSIRKKEVPLQPLFAPVAELVDALDLGSNVSRRAGSSPVRRTSKIFNHGTGRRF